MPTDESPMSDDLDIIECPFRADDCILPLIKTSSGYEMRVCSRPDSKKVVATKSKKNVWYLHVRIDDYGCRHMGYTENMYLFCTPADFYVPIDQCSREFYSSIYDKLVHGDMQQCMEVAQMFSESYIDDEVPMYPAPVISTVESFENYNFKDFRSGRDRQADTIHAGYDDEIPCESIQGLEDSLMKLHSLDVMEVQKQIFAQVFSVHPILRISNVIRMFDLDERASEVEFSNWKIKKLLPLHAYFITSGPWRGCWTRFGFDPKADQSNFKYQIYDSRKSGRTFQVFEAENVVSEVERNKPWYLTDKPSFRTGFHTKALLNLLKFRSELEFHQADDGDEMDFEVYD